MDQSKLANLLNSKSVLCTPWSQHSCLKTYKTKYAFKNGKLKLLKTCFIGFKLLGNEDPSFCGGVITKYSNKPLHEGGLLARPPNGGSA